MFTNVYSNAEIKDISKRISQAFPVDAGGSDTNCSTTYELQEDIAALGMQLAIQDRLVSNLLLRVSQLEDSLPLIGI
tara:strand:+ start:184 stop:414 length:231 start_codon:yes stop_codon:yes gene_type:complete